MILEFLGFLRLTFVDVLDILLVAVVIYLLLRWIKGSSAMNIFIAIILLLLVRIVASALGMKMISALLGTIIDVGAIAIIVIFQPEIRRFLSDIGRSAGNTLEKRTFIEKLLPHKKDETVANASAAQISEACREMSESKTGALIVVRRNAPLDDIVSTGDIVDAQISSRLIQGIFFKNSPMHDGAMVIDRDRIWAARCTLPITDRTDLPANYGMRHKAAIGLSEQCDADIIVVSEQTGRVSVVHEGKVTVIESFNTLKLILKGDKTL